MSESATAEEAIDIATSVILDSVTEEFTASFDSGDSITLVERNGSDLLLELTTGPDLGYKLHLRVSVSGEVVA